MGANNIIAPVVMALVILGVVATQIGKSEYGAAAALGLGGLGAIFLLTINKKVRIEAKILAILFIGYLCGGRGFAYINVGGIFVGEMVMVAVLAINIFRMTAGEFLFVRHIIFIPIIITLVFSTARFALIDFPHYQDMNTIRDFAMVYYSIFFIFGYNIGRHYASYIFMRKAIIYGLYISLIVSFFETFFPSMVYQHASFVISRVKDTQGYSLLASALFFMFIMEYKSNKIKYVLFSILCLAGMFMTEARTAYVAFAASCFFLVIAGKIRYLIPIGVILSIGLALAVFLTVTRAVPEDSKIVRVVEHVFSVIDFDNKLQLAENEESLGTNKWRTLWWQTIWDDTMAENPIFGLGFGYHLGAQFAEVMMEEIFGYTAQSGSGEAYEARSPHNYFFSVIGRLGLFGLTTYIVFLLIFFSLVFYTANAVRTKKCNSFALYWILLPMILTVEGWFSIVLEGPYGAIQFWILLGLAINDHINKRYYVKN